MIEQDKSSWDKGFADGKAGKRDVEGVSDRLGYESGFLEGSADRGEEPEEEIEPEL